MFSFATWLKMSPLLPFLKGIGLYRLVYQKKNVQSKQVSIEPFFSKIVQKIKDSKKTSSTKWLLRSKNFHFNNSVNIHGAWDGASLKSWGSRFAVMVEFTLTKVRLSFI